MFQQTILIYGCLAAWSLRTDAPSAEDDTGCGAPQEWRGQARLHAECNVASIALPPDEANSVRHRSAGTSRSARAAPTPLDERPRASVGPTAPAHDRAEYDA